MVGSTSPEPPIRDNGAMTNYPGEPPTPANQPDPSTPGANEPTQEVGYWQQQAQEPATEPTTPLPPQQPVWNPTTQQPYGSGQPAPSYPAAPPPPAQTPPPPAYGAQPPVGGYGMTPQPGYPAAQPPVHPDANTALITGIVALAGTFVCFLPIFASPFAWYLGTKALRNVRASNGQYRGESEARIGQVLGIIGTVLLILAILGFVFFFVLAIIASSGSGAYYGMSA